MIEFKREKKEKEKRGEKKDRRKKKRRKRGKNEEIPQSKQNLCFSQYKIFGLIVDSNISPPTMFELTFPNIYMLNKTIFFLKKGEFIQQNNIIFTVI